MPKALRVFRKEIGVLQQGLRTSRGEIPFHRRRPEQPAHENRSSPMSADGFTQVNSSIYIYTLGRFDLVIDGQPLRFARRAPMRPLELLGALIACGGRSVGIGTLSDLLWPEADGYDAYRAFTTTLHRLRRVLVHPDAVRLSAGRLSLDPQIVQVDVWN